MKSVLAALLLSLIPLSTAAMTTEQYALTLAKHIRSHWKPPRGMSSDEACVLKMELKPDGDVANVEVSQCSRPVVKASALRAVSKATPMPLPDAGLDFEKVKNITLLLRR